MTERKPTGMSFQTWVESQISQGLARGDFEGLAGAGKPLPRRDREETAYDWAVAKARREGVDTGAMLPPGLALRRERDELPARVGGLGSEDAVRALAEDYNARVQAFWRRPQESRWAPVPGLADVDALVAHWRATRPPPAPPPEPAPPAVRRRWWHRRGA
ncbi:DnaJ family domain-containing protein [Geodermatophilus sp. SYSU D00079]